MPSITEGQLTFTFPARWTASKFDEWSFYRKQFNSVCGSKAMDIVALDDDCCWLIEVKDYRQHRRAKKITLAEEVARKARDTLAALAAARVNAKDAAERAIADGALRRRELRVVLHLEQPRKPSKLFPQVADAANVQQRLRQHIKPIDAHAVVRARANMRNCAWTVS